MNEVFDQRPSALKLVFKGQVKVSSESSLLSCQVMFCNPVIERRPKLQRQKRIFPKQKGNLIANICPLVGEGGCST